jgi:hypothetical protein
MKQFYPELKNWKGKCVGDAEIFYSKKKGAWI